MKKYLPIALSLLLLSCGGNEKSNAPEKSDTLEINLPDTENLANQSVMIDPDAEVLTFIVDAPQNQDDGSYADIYCYSSGAEDNLKLLGSLYLDGNSDAAAAAFREIHQQISDLKGRDAGGVVIIKATDRAPYAGLVSLLDQLQINSVARYRIDDLTEQDSLNIVNYNHTLR